MSEFTPARPRHDIYGPVHKGLRLSLSTLLVRLGSTDFTAPAACAAVLADLRRQLAVSAGHLHHEEVFIHGALEARAPGATAELEHAHREHDASFAALEALMGQIEAAAPEARAALGRELYLAFSRFVAEDFVHMAHEETVTQPLLWSLFTDEELMAIEGAIVGSLPPEELMGSLSVMVAAMNPQERFGFLSFARASAPPEAFQAMIEAAVRPSLSANDWTELAGRLGVAA